MHRATPGKNCSNKSPDATKKEKSSPIITDKIC